MDLPQEFLGRMRKMLGEEYEAFLQTYREPRQFGLRVNTLKISVDAFVRLAPFHLRRIPWTDNGFYYEKEDDPARHPFYYAGLYYLQEPSAMMPATVLPVSPGERVLDLCAAPGGKATALAAKLQGKGPLVANEISASRAKALLKNLEIFGAVNSFVTNAAPYQLAEQFPEYFDRILVDAPCSGEGMFRKDPANARAWSLDKVEACAKTQREITLQAAGMLRPGGLMLYSTCTFSPEENEGTIACLLRQCPELELVDLPTEIFGESGMRLEGDRDTWNPPVRFPEIMRGRPEFLALLADPDMPGSRGATYQALRDAGLAETDPGILTKCVRILPHRMDGEGHFLALLAKRRRPESGRISVKEQHGAAGRKTAGSGIRGGGKAGAAKEDRSALEDFFRDVHTDWAPEKLDVRGGQAYYVPEPPQTGSRLPFLRNGLYLGELRRGRFEPSQAFAMALKSGEYASVLDFAWEDPRVRRYLCGETIMVDDLSPVRSSGWQLVCVCGFPLGWGRLVNGTLKNKYHPGWRMQI